METIEQEIKKFLDKWSSDGTRQGMDIALHFFMRSVIRSHGEIMEPEEYTPERKNI